jgi:phosphohistidine phosphatase
MAIKLLLFRHAKSDWDGNFASDHERPLAPRGIKAAKTMGKLVAQADLVPDIVLTSTAVRAVTTIQSAMQTGKWDCPLEQDSRLYATDAVSVVRLLQDLSDAYKRVMLVGHEPTWSELTEKLIGGGNVRFPTAAISCISFSGLRWPDVIFGSGELRCLLKPRLFGSIF